MPYFTNKANGLVPVSKETVLKVIPLIRFKGKLEKQRAFDIEVEEAMRERSCGFLFLKRKRRTRAEAEEWVKKEASSFDYWQIAGEDLLDMSDELSGAVKACNEDTLYLSIKDASYIAQFI